MLSCFLRHLVSFASDILPSASLYVSTCLVGALTYLIVHTRKFAYFPPDDIVIIEKREMDALHFSLVSVTDSFSPFFDKWKCLLPS